MTKNCPKLPKTACETAHKTSSETTHRQLELTGQNLGRVLNSRLGRACICRAIAYMTKRPNLKLKTRRKQLLGFLPLAFAHPELPVTLTLAVIALATLGNETQIEIS